MGFDWRTAGFAIDDAYLVHALSPSSAIKRLTESEFDERVRALRRGVVARYALTSVVWEPDDIGASWSRSCIDHNVQVRRNATGPQYTLFVDDLELADLASWPEAWKRRTS